MAQFNTEITSPGLPVTPASGAHDVVRLQEWLVVHGINVGSNAGVPPGSPAAAGIDGGFGNGTQAGCSAFAAANGLANGAVDAVFWQKLTGGMAAAFSFRSTMPKIEDAVVETAESIKEKPPRRAAGRQPAVGQDKFGPWVRAYCLGQSVECVSGIAVGEEAFAAFNRSGPSTSIRPRYCRCSCPRSSRPPRTRAGSCRERAERPSRRARSSSSREC